MADRISPEHRSWNMSRISGKNTRPEKSVRSILHRMGLRFRIHRKDLPGKPDIVLTKFRTVVFVHGCFWHQHKRCKYANIPKTRTDFWKEKFYENKKRDLYNVRKLKKDNWKVLTVWECELHEVHKLENRLKKLFQKF